MVQTFKFLHGLPLQISQSLVRTALLLHLLLAVRGTNAIFVTWAHTQAIMNGEMMDGLAVMRYGLPCKNQIARPPLTSAPAKPPPCTHSRASRLDCNLPHHVHVCTSTAIGAYLWSGRARVSTTRDAAQ
jgi:hypothetical protein